ncbi:MAG TPA: serine/threonine-protein kinase [Candidatus Xenobia bacterium]
MKELSVGAVLQDRYEVTASIRAGGMGAVYRAIDRRFTNREVALKRMLDPEGRGVDFDTLHRRFVEEANVLTGLHHPGIPQVYDCFSEEDSHYIAMEFIHGDSLDVLLEEYIQFTNEPMPPGEAVYYALQVADILTYLHTREPKAILHRDVKPANIVRNRDTRKAVLVDFGLARGGSTGVTLATAVGTLGYAAYEQVVGKPDPRSDIYALGATLWHLLTGKVPPPFEIPPLAEAIPDSDKELARIVDWATRADIGARPQSAQAYADALRELKVRLDRTKRPGKASTDEPPPPLGALPETDSVVSLVDDVTIVEPARVPILHILAGVLGILLAMGVVAIMLQFLRMHPAATSSASATPPGLAPRAPP